MEINKFIMDISGLSCVQRFSQSHMAKPENVLEHSGFASLLSLFIGRSLIEGGADIDLGVLLSKALLHDFDEVITGDIAMPIKYHSEKLRTEIALLESEKMMELSGKYSISEFLFSTWDSSKIGIEGAIVSLVDTICALYKFHNEIVLRSNKTMLRIYDEKIIKSIEEKIEYLMINLDTCFDFLSGVSDSCKYLSSKIMEHKDEN